ncbi:uncharacterized protein QC761_103360 [Podospora bellae-mahoneyi]|uniref:Uncharacterized protein n=1 Tax=Podospora bellae-mahoneyi TaxID=2093777 RepID=A0ABR0FUR7_9PEZI|nr:hypothetical protein QC761_103360 [Podospora bellae-mahoneyi]
MDPDNISLRSKKRLITDSGNISPRTRSKKRPVTDSGNESPHSEPNTQRSPWNTEQDDESSTIVRPSNPRRERYHSVSNRRKEGENSSSGAWSHKAEPPSAPSERAMSDGGGDGQHGGGGRREQDDGASTYTQRLYDHVIGERFTPSRTGHHHRSRTPRPAIVMTGPGGEQEEWRYEEDDRFENVELGGGEGFVMEESNSPGGGEGGRRRRRKYYSSFSWWKEEYVYAGLSVVAVVGLAGFLRTYDGQVLPQEFGWSGISFETGVVALVTAMRLCMDAYVGSAISQGAWLWVSESAQMRRKGGEDGRCGAKLEDFGKFDAASRGLRGAIKLIWRLKGRHLGCVGAAIAILGVGFETFSQEMVSFEQQPRHLDNGTLSPAPAPARYVSVFIDKSGCLCRNYLHRASCGDCVNAEIYTKCNKTANTCTYTTGSGTSIVNSMDPGERSIFKVAPTNGTVHKISSTSRAYYSVFDFLSVTQTEETGLLLAGSECALWFCVEGLKIWVEDGKQNQTRVANHSLTSLTMTSAAHGSEHVFINIPPSLNTDNATKYVVTREAMLALRNFMSSITMGTVTTTINTLDSSSDWVEAMWNATTGDLNQWINTFAASLTNEFRLHGAVTQTTKKRYDGDATQMTPVVKVRWYWLMYPAFMILLSIYFLFHTVLACSMAGVRAWKGEVLPLLFCRVDEGLYERGRAGLEIPGGLEKRVAGENVAMYRSAEDGGWGFRTVEHGEWAEEVSVEGEKK